MFRIQKVIALNAQRNYIMGRQEGQQKLIDPKSGSTPNTENFHKVVTGKDEGQKGRAEKVVEEAKKKDGQK